MTMQILSVLYHFLSFIGPSVKFSKTHQGDIHIIDDIKDFNSKMTPVNWMAIKYDDGNHQRELR